MRILITSEAPAGLDGADADIVLPPVGASLAEALFLFGRLNAPTLCSGNGRCGRCRARFLSAPPAPSSEEKKRLLPEELNAGIRLTCLHAPQAGQMLELPIEKSVAGPRRFSVPSAFGGAPVRAVPIAPPPPGPGIAVDLGTTSIHWEGPDGKREAAVNPQAGAGSDVAARLAAASSPAGAAALQAMAADLTALIVREAEKRCGQKIARIVLAANPAMTALFLGMETRSLAVAPYSLPLAGGEWYSLADLPPVWVPPQFSPFVGGDVAAGYVALVRGPQRPEYPFALADLGTNGEFLLAPAPDRLLVSSVPLGPALEGTGLTFGAVAGPGVITGFHLSPHGLTPDFYENRPPQPGEKAQGISGTGYLDLLCLLIQCGAMSREGHFNLSAAPRFSGPGMPLQAPLPEGPCMRLPYGLYISGADVEELLKVKAAFSLGLALTAKAAGTVPRGLKKIYLAGALGTHANPARLTGLGFFPEGMEERIEAAGNTSLAGAVLLRDDEEAAALARQAALHVEETMLAGSSAFAEGYMKHMTFSWISEER